MPSIYRVVTDLGFQYLEPKDRNAFHEESRSSWSFNGLPVGQAWEMLEVYVREPLLTKPDIWAIPGAIALEPHAKKLLQSVLDQSAEQLKLPFEGRTLAVVNVTYVLECLDTEKSDIDPDLPNIIDEYVFHTDRIDYSLFKIPQTRYGEILTVEGLASPQDEFKPIVEEHGLQGLRFDEIYTW